jgi:hypothetical protein
MLLNKMRSFPTDPAIFADEVRALASEAHQTINDSGAAPSEFRALLRRVARLESQALRMKADDLSEWLSNLRRELDSRLGFDSRSLRATSTSR